MMPHELFARTWFHQPFSTSFHHSFPSQIKTVTRGQINPHGHVSCSRAAVYYTGKSPSSQSGRKQLGSVALLTVRLPKLCHFWVCLSIRLPPYCCSEPDDRYTAASRRIAREQSDRESHMADWRRNSASTIPCGEEVLVQDVS